MIGIRAFVVTPVITLATVIPEVHRSSLNDIGVSCVINKIVRVNVIAGDVVPKIIDYLVPQRDAVGIIFKEVIVY
jgi:hypothetical protein